MITADVILDEAAETSKKVTELKKNIPGFVEDCQAFLAKEAEKKAEFAEMMQFELSEVNSDNFQVLGVLFRTTHLFISQNGYPGKIRIHCNNEKDATTYRAVYNFYIPETKADRLPDDSWD